MNNFLKKIFRTLVVTFVLPLSRFLSPPNGQSKNILLITGPFIMGHLSFLVSLVGCRPVNYGLQIHNQKFTIFYILTLSITMLHIVLCQPSAGKVFIFLVHGIFQHVRPPVFYTQQFTITFTRNRYL